MKIFSFTLKTLAKEALLKIPPIQKIFRERNEAFAENRRLTRELESLLKNTTARPQTKALPIHPLPRKLHLGCGFDLRRGYLNVDLHSFHKPDVVADVKSLPMLPSGYFEEILAIDVLEHLHRDDTEIALKEWARLMSPGATLRLRVPSILDLSRLLRQTSSPERQAELIQNLFGTQAYTGDYHYTGFTRPLINHYLRKAGIEPEPEAHWELIDGWMIELSGIKAEKP